MHNNQFSDLKRDSELFKSSSSTIDGRGVFKTTSEEAEKEEVLEAYGLDILPILSIGVVYGF